MTPFALLWHCWKTHAYETLEDMRDELNAAGLTAEAQDCAQV
ncbi:MAG: hypothetical protein ACLUI3_10015 [Christensenellales bacterium]